MRLGKGAPSLKAITAPQKMVGPHAFAESVKKVDPTTGLMERAGKLREKAMTRWPGTRSPRSAVDPTALPRK